MGCAVAVTAPSPANTGLIESYGDGQFRVGGELFRGSVLVLPERVLPWPVTAADNVSLDSLQPLLEAPREVDVLLIGCGPSAALVPTELRQALRSSGISVDSMGTGAACRTYNVLRAEERRVAAALIAVD